MSYSTTYNPPISKSAGNQTWNIDPWLKSCRVRVYGGGGGGEYINNSLTSTAGGNGGSTSIFGVIAGGGYGGGRRNNGTTAKNVGGNGGSVTLTGSPNLGVSITQVSGSAGSFPTRGNGASGGVGNGGAGSSGSRTYTSSSYHVFNNSETETVNGVPPNSHSFVSTSPDISLSYQNPGANLSGSLDRPTNGKYYALTFVNAYANNNWSYSVSGVCNQAAGGNTGGAPYTYQGARYKSSSGISLWFQTGGGGNGYIRCFTITTTGIKIGAIGKGGGGGAFAEFELTRQNLIDAGYNMNPYNVDGTQQIGDLLSFIVGGSGSSSVAGGAQGAVQIAWYEIPQVYLESDKVEIITGQKATLTWITRGDANAISFTSGGVDNGNLESFEEVYPTITTTYTATAIGIGGTSYNTESSVTILVYQIPTIDEFEVPVDVDYGTGTIQIEYGATYCDTSLKIVVKYSFDEGPQVTDGIIEGETIEFVVDSVSPFFEDTLTKSISGTLDLNLPWAEWGPADFEITMTAVGSGGSISQTKYMTVNIDREPDNLDFESRGNSPRKLIIDAIATSPGVDIVDQGFELTDVDIPVEIKSNYPIQVTVNDVDDWQNIREI